jgi:cytolysin-activating lysine-acyltransferase
MQHIGYFEALGMITSLTMQAELYRNWFVYDLDEMIVPAILCGQYKIYLSDAQTPVAFITWAFLNDKNHEKMLKTGSYPNLFEHSMQPDLAQWTNGSHLWLMDMICLNQNARFIVRDVQKNHFKHIKTAYAIRRHHDGTIRKMAVWKNDVSL